MFSECRSVCVCVGGGGGHPALRNKRPPVQKTSGVGDRTQPGLLGVSREDEEVSPPTPAARPGNLARADDGAVAAAVAVAGLVVNRDGDRAVAAWAVQRGNLRVR